MARRTGLGKGLGALIPADAVGDRDSVLRELPIGSIRPNTLQPRTHFDEESMSSLAASIQQLGVLQPVLVREIPGESGTYELIAGERRWRAARRASLQTVPALVQTSTSDVDSLEQALVENLHREDLNVLEEAAAFLQLIDEFGFTHEQVATRVGRSRTTVTNTLRLLQLPAGVQRSLADGTISAGHAKVLLSTPDRAMQEALATRVVSEGLTVRGLEEVVRATNPQEPEPAPAPAPVESITNGSTRHPAPARKLPQPGVLELEELLANHLNTRVKVDLQNQRGRVVIEFATLEDLERIYRCMLGDMRDGTAAVRGES